VVAELAPERDFRGLGCGDGCIVIRAWIPGQFGRSELFVHDPDAHETYGRLAGGDRVAPDIVVTGPIVAELRAGTIAVAGREVMLSRTEWQIFACLAARGGAMVPYEDVVMAAWGAEARNATRKSNLHMLRVHLSRLRWRLRPAGGLIATVRNIGLRLQMIAPEAAPPVIASSAGCSISPLWQKREVCCRGCSSVSRQEFKSGYCRKCWLALAPERVAP
jgi:DNA-binding winged helix-turn-helix (wHTH) protein